MNRRSFLQLGGIILATSGLQLPAQAAYLPPLYRRAILGINNPVNDAPPTNSSLHALETDFGMHFPWASVFWNLDTAHNPQGHDQLVNDFKASGRGLQVVLQPEKYVTTVQMVDISAGVYDADLLKLFNYLRAYGLPVVIRFAHEMNGNWYKWGAEYELYHPGQGGCKSTTEYIAAWRHVVDLERSISGTSNIRWFWCTNATDSHDPGSSTVSFPMESYYPGKNSSGKRYADIVGADGYNNNTGYDPNVAGSGDWRSFEKIFCDPANITKSPWYRINKLDSQSPFWIGETGCVEAGANEIKSGVLVSKSQWLTDMFNSTTALTGSGSQLGRYLGVHYFTYSNRSFSTSTPAHDAAKAGYVKAINSGTNLITGWGVRP